VGAERGRLTLFLRSEQAGEPLLPSGMLGLTTSERNLVGYLTDLKAKGSNVRATVRGGSFEGPAIGTLTGTMARAGAFKATVRATGVGRVAGDFVRVGKAPDFAEARTWTPE
jgi:hypothetical protein